MAIDVAQVETQQARVRAPLARLAGTIRRYILIEGAAAVLLYVALWFWLGLAADYGSFKLADYDWVQELPRAFRGVLRTGLALGFVGVIAFQIIRRLWVH